MDRRKLYDCLINVNNKDYLIVTFLDGDQYRLSDLNCYYGIGYENVLEERDISVDFEHCLHVSNKWKKALHSKYPESFRIGKNGKLHIVDNSFIQTDEAYEIGGVSWSSVTKKPVGALYEADEIESIFNEEMQYFVYQKNKEKE